MNNKDKIIKKIQKIRSKNNKHWMSLMRIAFKYAQKKHQRSCLKLQC